MVGASDHVLIHGGVGGVGHVAIQLAKTLGARIATTVPSAETATLAKSFGADETINFREETVSAYTERLTAGRGFDVVIDRNIALARAMISSSAVMVASTKPVTLPARKTRGVT
jgi:NADPH:quinone reductase-like Zn-dependent oxidoreductase